MFRFAPVLLALCSASLFAHFEVTDFATVQRFRAGETVHFERGQLQSGFWLDGVSQESILERPRATYYIRIVPGENQFLVKIGCRVITREIAFAPIRLASHFPPNSRILFVSTVGLGGSKSQAFKYANPKRAPMPKADFKEFTALELLQFEHALTSLLNQFEESFHLESWPIQAEETVSLGDMQTFIEPYTLAVLPSHGLLRQLIDRLVHRPTPEMIWRSSPRIATGSILALMQYVERLLKSGKSQPEVLTLEELAL